MTRKRAANRTPDLDEALRRLFRNVEVRVVPDRLRQVIDQLEAQSRAKASA